MGDYVNAFFLGGPNNKMIGNSIQSLYITQRDYPTAAALSFVLMAGILAIVFIYIRFAGSEALMGDEEAPAYEAGSKRMTAWLRRNLILIFAVVVVIYMLLPIAVIIAFSFNDPAGRYNFTWVGFTLDHWKNAFSIPELNDALLKSIELAALATVISTALGTMIALALVRYEFFGRRAAELPDRDPDGDARGRDRRRAAVDVLGLRNHARLHDPADRTRHVLHQLRRRRRALAVDRLRPKTGGSRHGPRRRRVHHLPQGDAAADHARQSWAPDCSRSRYRSTTS